MKTDGCTNRLNSERSARTDGGNFLQNLTASSRNGFDRRFASISTRLGLGTALSAHELGLLHEATLAAMWCYIALNGLGGCRGVIKPEREINRVRLESEFMAARDKCYASAGWKALPESQRVPIRRIFLKVFVEEENLAW
jgi:hypothetical protein